ncbi:DUF3102 domain-containing protein [Paenibacillus xylanilyticus]|uniref:DUF3102 domain-containing protein n=1 Tax=Paenibacillus xylanilyticus TaxID=248903 RepID=A0A7Y6BZS8_9BACL|nr:DUF3102 domain-containing protein [Paenibacillus xylanilyticus]NUU77984.1 DUF3102 domain-containing protein [Paenibacillus xylanilyticus]
MSQLAIRTIETIAIEINSIKDHTKQIVLHSSIEIGRRLTEAKEMMPHGEWMNWLADSVDYKQSTANNLMKIFKEYGSDQLTLFGDNADSQALGSLNYTQAVALLGIPAEEREAFVQENDVDSMSTRELQEAVKARKDAEKALKAAQAEAEKAKKAMEKEQKLREKLEAQQADHALIVERLEAQAEEAAAAAAKAESGEDDGQATALQEELEKAKQEHADSLAQIKKLEQELKAKPIDVPAIVEKVPAEIEAELAELRKKVAQGTGEEAAIFKAHFKNLNDAFANLLSALEIVGKTDEELHAKYKAATNGLIDRMKAEL